MYMLLFFIVFCHSSIVQVKDSFNQSTNTIIDNELEKTNYVCNLCKHIKIYVK